MDNIQLVQAIMRDFDKLTLKGVADWEIGVGIAKALISLKQSLEKEQEEQKKAEDERIKELRKQRQKQLADAEAQGLEVVGGETIRINGDGTTEVLIP
jgi:hypothetical protein